VCVTLSLLIVAKRMAKSRVLVKNLSVIETLSCVNVIASDKTGTLTQNKMFVASAATGTHNIDLADAFKSEYVRTVGFNQLVSSCGLCNNAAFESPLEGKHLEPVRQRPAKGDATDIALLKFSTEYELFTHMTERYKTLAEIPFNSKNKWMVKVVKQLDMEVHEKVFAGPENDYDSDIVLLKGAPDYLIKKSTHIIQPVKFNFSSME
jgi:sodium/potassium-transporting ATPase subunit alpha